MRTFGALVLAGGVGLLSLKVLGGLMLPLLGLTVGLLGMALKVAIVFAIGYSVLSLLKSRRRNRESA